MNTLLNMNLCIDGDTEIEIECISIIYIDYMFDRKNMQFISMEKLPRNERKKKWLKKINLQ